MAEQEAVLWIDFKDGDIVETVAEPDKKDIEQLCERFEIDFDSVYKLIEHREYGVYKFMIDVPVFRNWLKDQRNPGEPFCSDCPDHEACATGMPCNMVKRVNDIPALMTVKTKETLVQLLTRRMGRRPSDDEVNWWFHADSMTRARIWRTTWRGDI